MNSKPLDWTNVLFIGTAHLLAVAGVVWLVAMDFHWQTLVLAAVWLMFSSISITGGYHRLFSHPTYKASWPLRLFYLCFGAAGVQNSALKWSSDHRVHHATKEIPPCMAVGEAAGHAAVLALEGGGDVGAVDVQALRRRLVDRGALLDYFESS